MSIHYKKHPHHPESILIRDFAGEVNVADIIDSWEYLIENKVMNPSIKGVINNLTTCTLKMDMSSFKTLAEYLKNHETLKNIKLAVLCDDPKTIIFPTLGQIGEKDLKIRPFSTIESAVNWINEG